MATNVVYNVFNGDDCAFESMTKEQIYELIANSIAKGELAGVDAENPFITRIKEQNKGVPLTFWVGTQAEFNAIETKANNCFYIITDSTAQQDIENALEELQTNVNGLIENASKSDFAYNFAQIRMSMGGSNNSWFSIGGGEITVPFSFNLSDKKDLTFFAFNEYGRGYIKYNANVTPAQVVVADVDNLLDYEMTANGKLKVKSKSPMPVWVTFEKFVQSIL